MSSPSSPSANARWDLCISGAHTLALCKSDCHLDIPVFPNFEIRSRMLLQAERQAEQQLWVLRQRLESERDEAGLLAAETEAALRQHVQVCDECNCSSLLRVSQGSAF